MIFDKHMIEPGARVAMQFLPELLQSAVMTLSVPLMLNDEIALSLLQETCCANKNENIKLLSDVKKRSIWHEIKNEYWAINNSIRHQALETLNGKSSSVRKTVIAVLVAHKKRLSSIDSFVEKDLEYQINRIKLKEEITFSESSVWFRKVWDISEIFSFKESKRVISDYIEEANIAPDPMDFPWTEHKLSLWYILGKSYYDTRNYKKAVEYLTPVWNNRRDSKKSLKDAAIASHLIGRIYSYDEDLWDEAAYMLESSIEIGEKLKDNYHLAHVYHTLGNLYARIEGAEDEAQYFYESALTRSDDFEPIVLQVSFSYGRFLLYQHRFFEAKEMLLKARTYETDIDYLSKIDEMLERCETQLKNQTLKFKPI